MHSMNKIVVNQNKGGIFENRQSLTFIQTSFKVPTKHKSKMKANIANSCHFVIGKFKD